MLFVGRKGAGKTANMLQAAARLQENARNLVVVIKPASYDFTAFLSLLKDMPGELKDIRLRVCGDSSCNQNSREQLSRL